MKNYERILVSPECIVKEALKKIDLYGSKFVVIVDEKNVLIGTLTDGDIRRGLISEKTIYDSVKLFMNTQPITASIKDSQNAIINLMRNERILQIPIIDEHRKVVGIKLMDEFIHHEKKDNWVLIMAGGLGSRLGELTRNTPKPMLWVAKKPILEIIIENFVNQGFRNFYISVNYLAHVIEDYFGCGEKFGVHIEYLRERDRLGTAGSLSLIPPGNLTAPIIVTNGDLISDAVFSDILDFHNEGGFAATIGLTEYMHQVPYGVVSVNDSVVTGIHEKPTSMYPVSAGINVISPGMLSLVPQNNYFDMPDFFQKLLSEGKKIGAYRINGYWRDIGLVGDYHLAQIENFEESINNEYMESGKKDDK